MILVAFVLYGLCLLYFFPTGGALVGMVSVLPVALVGTLLGQIPGILAGAAAIVMLLPFFAVQHQLNFSTLLQTGVLQGGICLIFFGCLTGWLHDQGETIRRQLVEKDQIAETLRRREDILDAISYAARRFLQYAEWEQAISDVMERLGHATRASHIYLVGNQVEPGGRPRLVLQHEWTAAGCTPLFGQGSAQPADGLESLAGIEARLRKGETLFGRIESFSSPVQDLLGSCGVRSVAIVPVYSDRTWWGFIAFDDCLAPRQWTPAEIEALEMAADILGASRHAHQADEAERQERILAEALRDTAAALSSSLDLEDVLDQILACAERVVPYDGINLMMIEDGWACTVRCRGYSERGLRDAVMALRLPVEQIRNYREMVRMQKPTLISATHEQAEWVVMSETSWIASYLGAPLIVKGEVIGFLNLDSSIAGFFSPAHADRLRAFADQAAVAIENARLFKETQQNTFQFRLLNEITHAALSASSLDETMRQIAQNLFDMFHVDGVYGVYLTLWDEKNGVPVPRAATGYLAETYPFLRFEPGESSITSQILSTGRVYLAEEGPAEEYVSTSKGDMLRNHAVLGLPLMAGEAKLGAVLLTFQRPHHFSPAEITLGIQATGQLALAIAKAQLLEIGNERILQLTRANDLISALGRVAARIETAADPEGVISTLGEQISRLGLNCWVALRDPDHPAVMSFRYTTITHKAHERFSRWKSLGLGSFPFNPGQFFFYERVITRRQAIFLDAPEELVQAIFPHLVDRHVGQILELAEASTQTKGIYAPLTIEDRVIGLLLVWGETLLESEVPAVSIFASQVAIAIQNTQLYAQVQRLALTDELTGLSNRRELFELGQREVEIACRFNRPLSILMIDIDHFKKVNDRHGHAAGDHALRTIAGRLRSVVRDVDIVSRYGGEEFVLLLLENQLAQAFQIGERIRSLIADTPISIEHAELPITISLGIAELDPSIHTLNELIDIADQALYQAKQTGRNRCCTVQALARQAS